MEDGHRILVLREKINSIKNGTVPNVKVILRLVIKHLTFLII